MKGVFGRLGMVGATLVASALIFGAIAGVVVVHRFQSSSVTSSTHEQGESGNEQGDNGNEQGDKEKAHGHGQSKNKAPKHAHPSPEPDESEDKDT